MNATEIQDFERFLRRRCRQWQAGCALRLALQVAGGAGLALLAGGVLDFFISFSDPARVAIAALIVGGAALVAVIAACRISILRPEDAARRLDALAGDRRQSLLTALELRHEAAGDPQTHLSAYLAARSLAAARVRLAETPRRLAYAWPEVAAQARTCAVQALLVLAVLALAGAAGRVILARLLWPRRDIPPYSRFAFDVTPQPARVLYDGTLDVHVSVRDVPARAPVWFVTRHAGRTRRVACFQEGGGRYAQRLERVVNPVEFCFAVGRARSPWYPVELLLQPQIAAARLVVTAPPYAGVPQREFLVGSAEAAGLRDSQAQLFVTSNRRLAGGELTVTPEGASGPARVVTGRVESPHTVAFAWPMESAALVQAVVRDLQGTANDKPLRFRQQIVPDAPPQVMLTEPGPFALATPDATVRIAGYAEDDLALAKVDFVRTVAGYRDRVSALGPEEATPRMEFSRDIDLRRVGVQPGQTLEFFAEARDRNPTLLGLAASDLVRVQIISQAEYADMLRGQIAVEEFRERFDLALGTIEQVREQLRALRDDVQAGKLTAAQQAERLAQFREVNRQARDQLAALAKDFAAFDLEEGFNKLLGHTAATLERNEALMARMDPVPTNLGARLDEMLAAVTQDAAAVQAQERDADEVARVGGLVELTYRYRELLQRQEWLVRNLERTPPDPALLRAAQRGQDEARAALLEFRRELTARVAALPEGYEPLRASAEEFGRQLDALEIPPIMQAASTAAANQDAPQAHHQAALALERLQQLLTRCEGSCFGGMCRKPGLKFEVRDALRRTLEQLCMGMGRGAGQGRGVGPGGGGAGGEEDGYAAGGYSPLNTPVFGPPRTRRAAPAGAAATAERHGATAAFGGALDPRDVERLPAGAGPAGAGASPAIERVPAKYRAAVQRYFQPTPEGATP